MRVKKEGEGELNEGLDIEGELNEGLDIEGEG